MPAPSGISVRSWRSGPRKIFADPRSDQVFSSLIEMPSATARPYRRSSSPTRSRRMVSLSTSRTTGWEFLKTDMRRYLHGLLEPMADWGSSCREILAITGMTFRRPERLVRGHDS